MEQVAAEPVGKAQHHLPASLVVVEPVSLGHLLVPISTVRVEMHLELWTGE
jgi:hypothetical protein